MLRYNGRMINDLTIVDDILRPTLLQVNLAQLGANYRAIGRACGSARVMVILKANAYGHGLVPVARYLEGLGVPYFGVAYLEEGVMLRRAGITTPILVLGGIVGNQLPHFLVHQLTITASSVEKLQQIDAAAGQMGVRARVHLKIDTGMERIGVHYYSAETLLRASLECVHTEIEGIYSHFANSDSADLTHARLQLARFQEVLHFYERHSLPTPCRHIANSGAILQLPESYLDMVRAGILFYGVLPSADSAPTIAVAPALRWQTRVVYFKVVRPHHPVSYGSTWQTERETRVITLPVGYGDGYLRAMSGQAHVLLRGELYPVIGRICMDQMMVDIGPLGTAYNGDEVVLLGRQGEGELSAEQLAQWAGTIPYEILTNINTRVPRIYVEEGALGQERVEGEQG